MTILQARPPTQAPHAPALGDITSIFQQVVGFIEAAVPKLVGLAYFLVVIAILVRLWKDRAAFWSRPLTEMCALGILFALMR